MPLTQRSNRKEWQDVVVSELLIRHLTMESYWQSQVDRARDQRPLLGRLLLVPNQQIIQVNGTSKQDKVFLALFVLSEL